MGLLLLNASAAMHKHPSSAPLPAPIRQDQTRDLFKFFISIFSFFKVTITLTSAHSIGNKTIHQYSFRFFFLFLPFHFFCLIPSQTPSSKTNVHLIAFIPNSSNTPLPPLFILEPSFIHAVIFPFNRQFMKSFKKRKKLGGCAKKLCIESKTLQLSTWVKTKDPYARIKSWKVKGHEEGDRRMMGKEKLFGPYGSHSTSITYGCLHLHRPRRLPSAPCVL